MTQLNTLSHRFESPDSHQTLAEGLAEYFEANPGLMRESQMNTEAARRFFRSHDIVHVLYGCSTSMPDEAIVKVSSLFGTTGGWGVLRGYTHHEVLPIYRRLPLGSTLVALLAAPYLVVRTLWRCRRQARRWPWADNEQYLDRPLAELRAMFGIQVAHARRGQT
jgi:hypothetical protein